MPVADEQPTRTLGCVQAESQSGDDEKLEQRLGDRRVLHPESVPVQQYDAGRDQGEQRRFRHPAHHHVEQRRRRYAQPVLDDDQQRKVRVDGVKHANEQRVAGGVIDIREQTGVRGVEV